MPKQGWTEKFEKGSENIVKGSLMLGVGVPLAIAATAAIGLPLVPGVFENVALTHDAVEGVMNA